MTVVDVCAGIRKGEEHGPLLDEENIGGSPLGETSLSEQEMSCIALLSKGLVTSKAPEVGKKCAPAVRVSVPLADGTASGTALLKTKDRIDRIRDKNRRAQQKYRERKKLRLSELTRQLDAQKKQLSCLQAERERLTGAQRALSCLYSMRRRLLACESASRCRMKICGTNEDGGTEMATMTPMDFAHIKDVLQQVQQLRESRARFTDSALIDMNAFQTSILDTFWKFEGRHCLKFTQLIMCGIIVEQDVEHPSSSEACMNAFKDLVQSMATDMGASTLKEVSDILDRASYGFEKLIHQVKFRTGSVPLPDSCQQQVMSKDLALPHLFAISEASFKQMKAYHALYKTVERIFTPEQVAKVWIESPTVAIPDAFQILSWVREHILYTMHPL